MTITALKEVSDRSDFDVSAFINEVAEGASTRDSERQLPFGLIEAVRNLRLGALRLPTQAGGAGYTYRQLLSFIIDLAAADPNVAHILRNHYCFVDLYAQPHVKGSAKWTKLVSEGLIFGLGAGELHKTVGAGLVSTTISKTQDGLRISGAKYYSTGSLYADYILIRAAWADGPKASVVLPTKRAGVRLVDDWDGIGQRLTGSGSTFLENVEVNEDEVFSDEADDGYRAPYNTTLGHILVTAVAAGVARAAANEARALIARRERSFSHAPTVLPAEDPILLQDLGEISSAAFATEALVLAAADALDLVDRVTTSGGKASVERHAASLAAAKAKVVIDNLALNAASKIFDVGGASATKRAENLDRHWRNIRTLISHNPASYKALHIGKFELDGTLLPDNGFF